MSQDAQPRPARTTHWMQRVIRQAALLLVAFLLGFVPMWWKSRVSSTSLSEAGRQLSLASLQNTLASAVIDARRGDYESARQAASSFFTSLRAEIDRGGASTLSPAQREGGLPLLTRRDEIITLLARSDPVAAEQLSDLYVAYRKGVGIK